MRKVLKGTLAVAASAAMVAGVALTPARSLAWGDNGGGRPSYTINQINQGVLGNKIVFNSISNSTIGNEKNFVGARIDDGTRNGIENQWNGNDITVTDGQEYLVRLYVHNNNPNGRDAVSENTRVAFSIPTTSAKQVQINGYIYSDNATPSEYWDYVNFNSNQAFHLEYVRGSALIENRGYASTAKGGPKSLSDEIVTNATGHGVKIGFDKAGDGLIPGCYGFASYITIKVKAVFDYDYKIEHRVRKVGDTEWKTSIEANVGDELEFRIQYVNTSDKTQNNVMIRDVLPKNLTYVPGSTVLINADYTLSINQDDLVTKGINIGHYLSGANALVDFKAVVTNNSLVGGLNNLANWAQGGVGQKVIQDYTTVKVQLPVEEPTPEPEPEPEPDFPDIPEDPNLPDEPENPEDPSDPGTPDVPTPDDKFPNDTPNLPNTGAGTVASSVLGLGSLVTSAGYYISSRKALRK